MANLSTLWVNIVPSVKGLKSTVAKELDSAAEGADRTGETIGDKVKAGAAAKFGAISGLAQSVFSKAGSVISSNITGAISRADQMNNFPKVMQNLGFSANDAAASIKKISSALDGLPTSTAAMTGMVQKIAPMCDSLDQATNISLAFNDALLAGGKSTQDQENALEQYSQMLAAGKVDAQAWLSVQNAMPGQLDQLAKSMLGPKAKANDLKTAMQDGKISFDQFNDALVKLDKKGENGFASFEKQARDSTNGISTAMSNMTSRVQKAIQKVIEAVGVDNIGSAINSFSSQFGKVGDAAASAVTSIKGWFGQLGTDLQQFDVFGGLQAAWNKFIGTVQSINWGSLIPSGEISGVTASIATVLGHVADAISRIMNLVGSAITSVGQFVGAFAQTGALSAFGDLLQSVGDALSNIWNACGNALTKLGELAGFDATSWGTAAGTAFKTVAGWAKNIADAVTAVSDWCSQHSGAVATAFAAIGTGLAVFEIGSTISSVVAALSALGGIIPAVSAAFSAFNAVLSANPLMLVVSAIAAVAAGLTYFFTQTETGRQMWASFCSGLNSAWGTVTNWFGSTINNIKAWFNGAGASIRNVWNGVVGAVASVPGRILGFFNGIGGRIGSKFNDVRSSVLGAFAGAGGWLVNAGSAIMDGLVSGLKAAWGKVTSFVGGIADWIKAHKGPISYDRVLLVPAGRAIMGGFADSLKKSFGGVKSVVGDVNEYMGSAFDNIAPAAQLSADWSKTSRANVVEDLSTTLTATAQGATTDIDPVVKAIDMLAEQLGPTIARYTPTMTDREFDRRVRKVV